MKLLARAEHPLQAAIWADTLRAAGIPCSVRNTALSGALGEIPFLECAPQIWLEREADEARARQILLELQAPARGPAWRCSGCGDCTRTGSGTVGSNTSG